MSVSRFVGSVMRAYAAHPALLAFVLGGLAYQVGFNLLLSAITRRLFDDVLPQRDGDGLAVLAAVLGAALVVRISFALGLEQALALLATRTMATLRARMFEGLQSRTATFFHVTPVSDLMTRFSSDLSVVEGAVNRLVARLLLLTTNILACTTMMFVLDVRLGFGVAVAVVLAFVLPRPLGARAAAATKRRREEEGRVLGVVQESIALHGVIRTFLLGGHIRGIYEDKLRAHRDVARGAVFAAGLVETSTVLILLVMQVVVLLAGSALAIRGTVSAGVLVAFTTLMTMVAASMFGISGTLAPLIEAAASRQRIDEMLGERRDATRTAGTPAELLPLAEGIRLDDVSFSYTGERDDVSGVTLDIPAGAAVAFVGPSGSGKSTLLSLVTRANVPASGKLLVDGHDLDDVAIDTLYRQMSVVSQESLLFDASVRDNIRMGRLDASDDDVEEAARRAEVHDAILGLANGYDTRVGERGGRLSGGQRQRIAIARAVLRDPRLLVLDEATSALDPATEHAVIATLDQLRKGRTVIAVTHRLSTVRDYDRIFVMNAGRLAQTGTHDELVAIEGVYRDLWEKQHGIVVSDDATVATLGPAFLERVPMFRSLSESTRAELARRFATMRHRAGHRLFEAGDPGDAFYVVAHGKVEITVAERRPRTCTEGDCFGEIALLDTGYRTASARAVTPCTLLVLARQHFEELLEREPLVAADLRRKAAQHLAHDAASDAAGDVTAD